MANKEQLEILKQGAEFWNKWRNENPTEKIDLSEANLAKAILSGVDLHEADLHKVNLSDSFLIGAIFAKANLDEAALSRADLRSADLHEARLRKARLARARLQQSNLENADLSKSILGGVDFSMAHLSGASFIDSDLHETDLREAVLRNAKLQGARLRGANFMWADLSGTDLSSSDLSHANLSSTTVTGALISNSRVYGINVWDLKGEFKEQKELVISPEDETPIAVDNVKVAQFVYLILENRELRDVINTLTSKSVLILGRFAIPERKAILDSLRSKLREYNLLPIVFDFDRPADKDFTETIKTLAGISYFVIADVTNPKSSPLELQATVPDYQIPFVPIIQEGESPFAMMVDLQKKYNWVLNTVSYDSEVTLMKVLKPLIIDPAMKKRQELRIIKAQEPEIISAKDYLAKGGS
ncbi:MAG: pentapeptide repeat-containing protein [Anaerolineales bacterium]